MGSARFSDATVPATVEELGNDADVDCRLSCGSLATPRFDVHVSLKSAFIEPIFYLGQELVVYPGRDPPRCKVPGERAAAKIAGGPRA